MERPVRRGTYERTVRERMAAKAWIMAFVGLLLCLAALDAGARGEAFVQSGREAECRRPVLVLRTVTGAIEVELVEEAAPEAVRWLVRLARGPIYHPEITATEPPESGDLAREVGFYDGLTFDFTRPHVEIAAESREPDDLFRTPTRIDARALGLDRSVIGDSAEAMSVLQTELLPEHVRNKKQGSVSPRLRNWIDRWYESQEADFLVGTSRREVAEALGYVYQEGLASLPPSRGAVALVPASPRWSSGRLSIFLTDLPDRAGRWMVVGRVVAGLEVAEEISARPLRSGPEYKSYRPADPVAIEDTEIECLPPREPPAGGDEESRDAPNGEAAVQDRPLAAARGGGGATKPRRLWRGTGISEDLGGIAAGPLGRPPDAGRAPRSHGLGPGPRE
jgi:cyclophilin family peptidyl-prolyl cis-trans isomerase